MRSTQAYGSYRQDGLTQAGKDFHQLWAQIVPVMMIIFSITAVIALPLPNYRWLWVIAAGICFLAVVLMNVVLFLDWLDALASYHGPLHWLVQALRAILPWAIIIGGLGGGTYLFLHNLLHLI